jgi:hypothetical protein
MHESIKLADTIIIYFRHKYTFRETGESGNAAMFTGRISPSGTLTLQFPSPLFIDPALVEGNLHWVFDYDLTVDR